MSIPFSVQLELSVQSTIINSITRLLKKKSELSAPPEGLLSCQNSMLLLWGDSGVRTQCSSCEVTQVAELSAPPAG